MATESRFVSAPFFFFPKYNAHEGRVTCQQDLLLQRADLDGDNFFWSRDQLGERAETQGLPLPTDEDEIILRG